MRIQQPFCYPLLAVDLWEHAYYLEYLYDKEEYIRGLSGMIDWRVVEMFANNYAVIEEPVPV